MFARSYDLVIFDLDGVVYLGSEAVPAAPESIRAIVEDGTQVAYVTNNASRGVGEVAGLLRSLGVPARDDEVLTSAAAAAEIMAQLLPQASAVLVVGSPSLANQLSALGLRPVISAAEGPVAVVQGYGPQVGWSQLAEACVAIHGGAWWVATNLDATMPSMRGPLPGNGSLVAALSTALGGRRPDLVVGKPEPALLQVAAGRWDAKRSLVVGDRLDTDMAGARRAGMDGLLVLTGVSTPVDVLRAQPNERPTHVAADLMSLSTPDHLVRVPAWRDDAAVAGRWRVTYLAGRLCLTLVPARSPGPQRASADDHGAGGDTLSPERLSEVSLGALRALAAAAWFHSDWSAIVPEGHAAARAVAELGLDPYAVPEVIGGVGLSG